jgi:hypothetical protein
VASTLNPLVAAPEHNGGACYDGRVWSSTARHPAGIRS